MNKEELINQISEELNISKAEVSDFVNDVFATIGSALRKGKNVNISEFGKFIPQKKSPAEGGRRNSVSFSPVKKLSNDVNYNYNELKPVTVALIPHAGKLQEVFEELDEEEINEEELIDVITEEKPEEVSTLIEAESISEEDNAIYEEEAAAEEEEEPGSTLTDSGQPGEESMKKDGKEEGLEEIIIEDNPQEQDVFYEDRISDIVIVDDKAERLRQAEMLERAARETSDEIIEDELAAVQEKEETPEAKEEDYNEILNRLIEENKPADETGDTDETETGVKDAPGFSIPPQLREQNTILPTHEEIAQLNQAAADREKARGILEEPVKEDIPVEKDEESEITVDADEYKEVDKNVPVQDIMKLIEERKKILEEIKRLADEKGLSTELPPHTTYEKEEASIEEAKDEAREEIKEEAVQEPIGNAIERPIDESEIAAEKQPEESEEEVKDGVTDKPVEEKDTLGTYLEEAEIIDKHDKDIREEEDLFLPSEGETEEHEGRDEYEDEEEETEEEKKEEDEDILIPDFSFDKIFKDNHDEDKDEVNSDDSYDGGDILLPEDIKALHEEIETPLSKEEAYFTTDDNFKLKDYDDVFEKKSDEGIFAGEDFKKSSFDEPPMGGNGNGDDDKVFKKSLIIVGIIVLLIAGGIYYLYTTGAFTDNGKNQQEAVIPPPEENKKTTNTQNTPPDTVKKTVPPVKDTLKTPATTNTTVPEVNDNTPEEQIFDASRNLIFIKKGSDFFIQAGSYKEKAAAEEKAAEFRKAGTDAVIAEADIQGKGKFYRVRVGKYKSLEEAKTAADNM